MYWTFYKSTVIINICVSIALSVIAGAMTTAGFFVSFAVCFATLGLMGVFLYKEVARPLEYYFYYNRGISKRQIMSFCFIFNILMASFFLIVRYYVSST